MDELLTLSSQASPSLFFFSMSSSTKTYGTLSTTTTIPGATMPESNSAVTHFPSQAVHAGAAASQEEGNMDVDAGGHYTRRKGCTGGMVEVVRANTGLFLVVAAQACFASMNTAVKRLHKVDPSVTTLQLMIVRMLFTLTLCLIYMFSAKIPDPILGPKDVRLLLLSRGVGGTMGLFGLFFSLQYLSLSDATVFTFMTPTTTALAAALLLKEVYTIQQAMAGLVSLIGVLFIARPAFLFGNKSLLNLFQQLVDEQVDPAKRLLAVGARLLGVFGLTIAYTSIRAIGKRCHPMHVIVSFSMQCVIVSTIGMLITRTPFVFPAGNPEWLILVCLIGILGILAQTFLTMGFQREAAGRGSMAVYTQLIFAMILEFAFFRTYPALLSLLGATMIIASAVYVALTKKINTPVPEPTAPTTKQVPENQDSEKAWLLDPENGNSSSNDASRAQTS